MFKNATFIAGAIVATLITTSAEAQQRRAGNTAGQATIVCDQRGCSDQVTAGSAQSAQTQSTERTRARNTRRVSAMDANGNTIIIGGRPAGCPHRYCGCEASRHVFGKIRPELNLASNWIKYFPRTSPAPGMAAARPGHVMVLVQHVDGDNWLVHDGNSGGGLTRRHVRSIRGHVVVNPHATRVALPSSKRERGTARNVADASIATQHTMTMN
ncbi:MAG: hypothetical protein Q8M24_24975 [Pseudolabrys sp.]|nr:hypothetical protein [Pseudolabrys sp.]